MRLNNTPGDVFRLAHQNATLSTVIHAWQAGQFPTWESAMTAAVVHLAEQNARLIDLCTVDQLAAKLEAPNAGVQN